MMHSRTARNPKDAALVAEDEGAGPDRAEQPAARSRPAVKLSGAAYVYQVLRQEIVTLALIPNTVLDETGLAARFGLSRSPIREALIRLEADGLVISLRNRGAMVAGFDAQLVPKFLDALGVMQRVTSRLAAIMRTPDDLKEINRHHRAYLVALREGITRETILINRDFHAAIGRASRNPYFSSLYQRLLDEGVRLLHMYTQYPDGVTGFKLHSADHQALVDAITAGDADSAEEAAHRHVQQFDAAFIAFISRPRSEDLKSREAPFWDEVMLDFMKTRRPAVG